MIRLRLLILVVVLVESVSVLAYFAAKSDLIVLITLFRIPNSIVRR